MFQNPSNVSQNIGANQERVCVTEGHFITWRLCVSLESSFQSEREIVALLVNSWAADEASLFMRTLQTKFAQSCQDFSLIGKRNGLWLRKTFKVKKGSRLQIGIPGQIQLQWMTERATDPISTLIETITAKPWDCLPLPDWCGRLRPLASSRGLIGGGWRRRWLLLGVQFETEELVFVCLFLCFWGHATHLFVGKLSSVLSSVFF